MSGRASPSTTSGPGTPVSESPRPGASWRVVRPLTIDDAVTALVEGGPTARLHAGGTDLMVQIREGRREPGLLVDLSLARELRRIEYGAQAVVIGATRPMSDLLADDRLTETFPALADAIRVVGSVQIRNRATLGGNIGNASPAADTVPVLVALDAGACIAGPDGYRSAPVASLFAGPGRTTLAPGELITAIEIPTAPPSRSAYLRLTRRASVDLALISVAVVLPEAAAPRVAFGAAGPVIERCRPVEEALAAGWSGAGALDRAAQVATESVKPISDVRAAERYRRAMAGVLLRRAVRLVEQRTIARAAGSPDAAAQAPEAEGSPEGGTQ